VSSTAPACPLPPKRSDFFDRPTLLGIWLQGYSTTDTLLREDA
jgi:hypothetical protein